MGFEITDAMNEMARYLVPYKSTDQKPKTHPKKPPVNLHKLFVLRKLFAIY